MGIYYFDGIPLATRRVQMRSFLITAVLASLGAVAVPRAADAQPLAPQERMCDPTFEDCRADILTYIEQETQQIDIAFWMMSDARYSNALVAARARGVTVRVLMDPRCSESHPACVAPLDQLRTAGMPMRAAANGILHWKMILFASQGQVEFSGANYVPFEFTPHEPWVNFTDEIIYYSNDPAVVRSMMTKFDEHWTSTTEFYNYANIAGPLTRSYPLYPLDPDLNFPPFDSYRARAVQAYDAEQQRIDILMFRITDLNHTWAMQRAVERGVPVRLITDEDEYRNPKRVWNAYNVDILHRAGVQVRLDAHLGLNHAKGVILSGSGLAIFGSSNWSSPSSDLQHEHNYFTTKPVLVSWLKALFERKWNNSAGHNESTPFVPLPPDVPEPHAPANAATGVPTAGVVLQWNGGIWAHLYDIYFGTSPNPPLLAENREIGPSLQPTYYRELELHNLQPGTTYYWRIVSKTMAHVTANGPVWSFTTAGTPPPPPDDPPPSGPLPAGWSSGDVGNTGAAGSAGHVSGTFTVTGAGADVWGTADQFHYAYTSLTGDGSIVARVASIQFVHDWTKAGVMIRNSLSPSAAHAFQLVAAASAKGVPLQRRPADGASSVTTAGSQSTAPRWVKLVRAGNLITGYESADGVNWSVVGTDTFTMGPTVLIGLAVSSHVTGTNATATFDNVSVTPAGPPPPPAPATLPADWTNADVGATAIAGSATYSDATFTVTGAGADVWGTVDAFHYAYRAVTGDATIVARVTSIPQGIHPWVKAGVMIRASLAADAPHAFMLASAARGMALQRRVAAGGDSTNTAGTLSATPRWVKLQRQGNLFSAYESADGVTWTLVATETIEMGATVLIGLAATSHSTEVSAACTFDNVSIQ